MSAYAMPGSFFLPLSQPPATAGSVSSQMEKDGGSSRWAGSLSLSTRSSICVSPTSTRDTGANAEKASTATPGTMATESASSAPVVPFGSGSLSNSKPTPSAAARTNSEVGIVVKSAKIDPIKLVQAVTRTTTAKNAPVRSASRAQASKLALASSTIDEQVADRTTVAGREVSNGFEPMTSSSTLRASLSGIRVDDSDSDSDDDSISSSSSSDYESEADLVTTSPPASPTSSDNICRSTVHDEAIEFELSISFNGRKYTATRALPSFVQLRNELVREMKYRGIEAQGRVGRRRRRMRSQKPSLDDCLDSDEETAETVGEDDDESLPSVTIPELPIGPEELSDGSKERDAMLSASAGVSFGRGFTMLQALMRSYCPAMERWLRHVADIVPPNTSPSLTKFLWEPLTSLGMGDTGGESRKAAVENAAKKRGSRKRPSHMGSFSTLGSIVENCRDVDELEEEEDHADGCDAGGDDEKNLRRSLSSTSSLGSADTGDNEQFV